ncbi:MAG TPA: hypothetical protein EYP14_16235, partial [Planctomycetaceae bacterium]|nr:hypothetical protein [Planctomycetaceae bacterium]
MKSTTRGTEPARAVCSFRRLGHFRAPGDGRQSGVTVGHGHPGRPTAPAEPPSACDGTAGTRLPR